ncbi:unnamed protein product [Chondrus crispus]|uniref:Uncharacterized protein n=1 Tax=Chondrus crispus TaxID=2769 RepID=R7QAD5_CHOCR|nr:unnamed protein product [Chondrus crispus]CDF34758.1 unnamed protein product [Chondrus crispus]|eukprot:XP_005714577.1 unnamed protein product [Chondrus crispus]
MVMVMVVMVMVVMVMAMFMVMVIGMVMNGEEFAAASGMLECCVGGCACLEAFCMSPSAVMHGLVQAIGDLSVHLSLFHVRVLALLGGDDEGELAVVGVAALVERMRVARHADDDVDGHGTLARRDGVLAEHFGRGRRLFREAAALAGLQVELEGEGGEKAEGEGEEKGKRGAGAGGAAHRAEEGEDATRRVGRAFSSAVKEDWGGGGEGVVLWRGG